MADDFEDSLDLAIDLANVPTLLPVLVQLTGDERWLEPRFHPSRPIGMDDNDSGGLPTEVQDEIRDAARSAIRAWLDGAPMAIPEPDAALLLRMLSVSMAEPVPVEYAELVTGSLRPVEARRFEPLPGSLHVVIVGAGFSGLIAGFRLAQAGIEFTILEKNTGVGGTWHDNRYPGAGVDTPSHLYTLPFLPNDWEHWFALQPSLLAYLERAYTELDIRGRVRLGSNVKAARFDEHRHQWEIDIEAPDGTRETLRAPVLISAVGIFNPPTVPNLKGLDTFEGTVAHTASWPNDLDLTDKRVGVIGTGASSMQLAPAIADDVAALTIFQRSPQWALPFPKFRQAVPEPVRRLMQQVPLYAKWYATRLSWTFNDKLHPSLQIDPEWEHPARSINRTNDRHRVFMTEYMKSELGSHADDLLPKVLPTYPPYGKRILLDNGWFRTLTLEHVELVTDPVAEVRPHGVITASGVEYDLDVLVLATGFNVSTFLSAFEIVGRDGVRLEDRWGDDGTAYLGAAVPGLPNFFSLYGPNLQPGHGGSILFTLERQVHYVVDLLRQMIGQGLNSVEVRDEVNRDYNDRTQARLSQMVWTHPGMQTYYRNSKGRIVVNSPYRHSEWWSMTEKADLADYVIA